MLALWSSKRRVISSISLRISSLADLGSTSVKWHHKCFSFERPGSDGNEEDGLGLKTGFETDEERARLLHLALNGDQEALDRLFASYMRPLYQAALRVLHSPQDAEDALQDGLLSALRHLKDFEGRSQFSTWLTIIVINAALMRLRKTRGQAATSIDEEPLGGDDRPIAAKIADPRPNPEELYTQEERFRILEKGLRKLPAMYRSAFEVRDIEGMDTGKAAKTLGVTTGTLKSQLHRGRMRIIKEIRHALVAPGSFERAPSRSAPGWHEPTVNLTREAAEPAV
jgi:RNA polymerase sigma-70 factor (ECF subfamily)